MSQIIWVVFPPPIVHFQVAGSMGCACSMDRHFGRRFGRRVEQSVWL